MNVVSTLSRTLILLCVAGSAFAGCAKDPLITSYVQPDPGGCYVLVFDQPRFTGAREFINGPARHPSLSSLPFDQNWQKRIRSVQVGIGVNAATIWVDEGFAGASLTLRPDVEYPVLDPNLSGEIESLVMTCIAGAGAATVN